MKWSITGVTLCTPDKDVVDAAVSINDDTINSINSKSQDTPLQIHIEDGVLTSGLINSHDHLLGTYFPKVGNGPYENWLPWDNDLKSSPVYQERQQIENRDLYLLGGYRNLISGVTTVSDHIPHFVAEPYYDIMPMKAIQEYTLAHSIASFALAWGDGVDIEYQKALKEDIPFITHIAEGFDNETVQDLSTLDRQGGLGDHSVLIHGIAFSDPDMDLIKNRGASVVWCGDSNMFMFNETTNIKNLVDKGINVCIGTDSPMSGGQDLLYEMKYDKALFEEMYGEELPDKTMLKMVTENAAHAFKLKNNGLLKEGYTADLTIFRHNGKSAVNSIVAAELKDVMLVIIDGKPVYGDGTYENLFDSLDVQYQHVTIDGMEKIIIGDLIGLLKRISRAVGFKKEFPFLPAKFDF